MPVALPLTTFISQDSQATRDYKIIETKYGNGYSQRAADGINSIQDSWNVTWNNLSSSEFSTVLTALDTTKGSDYLTWTAPGDGASKKYICRKVTKRALAGNLYSVSAELQQVFDL
jgi:phage-related protein